jgi:REP-associated tyrosine transposase
VWGRATSPARFSIIYHKTRVRSTPNVGNDCIIVIPMLRKYEYRRTLPHYQGNDNAIFATFATHHRWHLPEHARDLVVDACLHLDGTKCSVHGFVVMPDHVHIVFTPIADRDGPISLPEILQKVKSESAHRINKLLGRKGRVWQDESFDHVLRREEGIDAKLEYIRQNPVRAQLVLEPSEYKWMWFEGSARLKRLRGRVARAHTLRFFC